MNTTTSSSIISLQQPVLAALYYTSDEGCGFPFRSVSPFGQILTWKDSFLANLEDHERDW